MRHFITMLGFNRAETVREAMINLEETTTDAEHRRMVKTVFLCQYPLPSIEENRAKIIEAAREFGWWHAEIPNRGVMLNHNTAIHDFYHMAPGDTYFTFDPDVRLQNKGWLSACAEALHSDPGIMFVSLARPYHDEDWCSKQHGRTIHTLPSGLRIARYKQLIAWSCGMWRGDWLAARPRDLNQAGKFYGFSEHRDYERLLKAKKTWVSLVDYYDHHLEAPDKLYTEWKVHAAGNTNHDSFDVWLKKRSK